MVKLTDAQLAAKYQAKPTKVAARPHYKGCQFGDHVIERGDEYKEALSQHFKNAGVECLNKLAPPPRKPLVSEPPKEIEEVKQLPIDCAPPASPPSEDIVKLLAETTSLLRLEREVTAKLQIESVDLRKSNSELMTRLKYEGELADACLRLLQKEKYIASPAFTDERNEIRRVMVLMNRWTVNNK